jgi:hypothetical protein
MHNWYAARREGGSSRGHTPPLRPQHHHRRPPQHHHAHPLHHHLHREWGGEEWARGSCQGHPAFQAAPTTCLRRPSPSGPTTCVSRVGRLAPSSDRIWPPTPRGGGKEEAAEANLPLPPDPAALRPPPARSARPCPSHPLLTGLRPKPSTRSAPQTPQRRTRGRRAPPPPSLLAPRVVPEG